MANTLGYYRLGASYPRSGLRVPYPVRRLAETLPGFLESLPASSTPILAVSEFPTDLGVVWVMRVR